eukprot:sb/3463891/
MLLLFAVFVAGFWSAEGADKPNILFVVIDDMGYGDIGYTYPEFGKNITTPLFDKLAHDGLILDRFYTEWLCTPARASLQTGRYAIALGIESELFLSWTEECLDRDQILLAEPFREIGYATHMVGKWHLGYARWECMPCRRGYETAYGYISGQIDYMTHDLKGNQDFYSCEEDGDKMKWSILPNTTGQYSMELFTSRIRDIVESHDADQPLFMMYTMQAVHGPFFAPESYFSPNCTDIANESCVMQAMLNSAEISISEIIDAYKAKGMWNNTLLVVMSDNGAPESRFTSNGPLRGWKNTLFEGGIRTPSFIYSPNPEILVPRGRTSCYVHVSDWYSSLIRWTGGWDALVELSKGRKSQIKLLDSIDQSGYLFKGENSTCPRDEVLLNIDPVGNLAGYISGDFKALFGQMRGMDDDCETGANYSFHEDCVNWSVPRLYNITADPFETTDLSETHPDVLEEIKERIMDYLVEMTPLQCTLPTLDDVFPTDDVNYFLPFDFPEGFIPDWATYAMDPPSFH